MADGEHCIAFCSIFVVHIVTCHGNQVYIVHSFFLLDNVISYKAFKLRLLASGTKMLMKVTFAFNSIFLVGVIRHHALCKDD